MKCFYHNDIDGRCAASIVARWENNYNEEDFIEYNYNEPIPTDRISPNEKVYFVDLSFSENSVDKLREIVDEKKCHLIWCDHHASSINLLGTYPQYIKIQGLRKIGISGAALTWMYLYGCEFEEIPRFIQLVSDFDCWIMKEKDTLNFKYGIEAKDHDALSPLWNTLVKDDSNGRGQLTYIIMEGKIIRRYVKREYRETLAEYGYESTLDGYKCLVVNRQANSLIFGDKMKAYPLVVNWAYDGTRYKYSIYSEDPNIDCSKIAEKYGGGGHKGASGFTTQELILRGKKR